jgi:pimeloyl-ACP methyl ester carboxylesterase
VKDPGTTQSFRGPAGELLRASIAEVAYLRLGGLEQWVMIRGESLANPPLILLQGGPGLSETHFFRYFNAPLEKAFTVVYWDQRGQRQILRPDYFKVVHDGRTVRRRPGRVGRRGVQARR